MPVYRCVVPEDSLTYEQRAEIATAFTDVHCGLSAAPRNFVHVLFVEAEPGAEITSTHGSGPVKCQTPYYIVGGNRGGRPPELKAKILAGLEEAFARIAEVPPDQVSGRIFEAPASWTMEAGKILPEPGREPPEWYEHETVSG